MARFLTPNTTHDSRHLNGCSSSFDTSVLTGVQASLPGLLYILEQQNLMNHRQRVLNLQLCQGTTHRLTNILSVGGFTAKDDAKAENCINWLGQAFGQGVAGTIAWPIGDTVRRLRRI